ncbi:TIGR00730 family Rossman fold protein [Candidatus Saccharibacteria bacterium]|nr:TIGR00730 family Rossman fold protein [Candidatus Saccharibacteria bacterium]
MEQIWLDQLKHNKNLTIEDIERSVRYAKDLMQGLGKLKTHNQGVTIFGSARITEENPYYQKARELGQKLAQAGHPVITGGGKGIMEAANRGAYEVGGQSIGLNIELPHEQTLNSYTTDNLQFYYFFARKVMLAMASKVYIYFPGGFGTIDEFSELLTLVQTEKIPPVPIILFGAEFWQPLDDFFRTKMEEMKMINSIERNLYSITDDVDYIVQIANTLVSHKIGENIQRAAAMRPTDYRGVIL